MIADWAVEVGPDCPVITAPWEDWVDLRAGAHGLDLLPEVKEYPELQTPLLVTNRLGCLTVKVDVFPVTRDEVDPEIAEAGEAQTSCGLGSYLDVLTVRSEIFAGFAGFEKLAKILAAGLRRVEAPCAACEIVVRPARLYDQDTFGWTVYAMGFGASGAEARERWAGACNTAALCFQRQMALAAARFEGNAEAGE